MRLIASPDIRSRDARATVPGDGAALGTARRLKVAHVTATFPPYRGGTGSVAWHQTRELARRGHDAHVFTALPHDGTARAEDDPEGVTVHRLPAVVRAGNAPVLTQLPAAVRGFELVHLHYPFYAGAELVWLACRRFHVPYVVTYHQDVVLQGALSWLPPLHYRLFGHIVLAGARRLLFTTLDYAQSSFAANLAHRKTSLELPNGVDAARFSGIVDTARLRAELHVAPDDVLALFTGGLDRAHYFKGVDVLLRALAQVTERRLRLVIVGDGDLRPAYQELAAALGVAAHVHFAGRVDDATLPLYYAACDLTVLPSTTRGEAFGIVLLEAMAAGKPVVASDLPGVRAVVRNTGGGLLARPADVKALASALSALAVNPALRRRLGSAGREAMGARYTWAALGDQLERVYHEALA